MDYISELIHAIRFTGSIQYDDQVNIWQVMYRIIPGVKDNAICTVVVPE